MRLPRHISEIAACAYTKVHPPQPLPLNNFMNKTQYLMLGPIFYQTTHVVRK